MGPIVFLQSSYSFLSYKLLLHLLEKGCVVILRTADESLWRQNLEDRHLRGVHFISDYSEIGDEVSYVLVVQVTPEGSKESLEALDYGYGSPAKVVFVTSAFERNLPRSIDIGALERKYVRGGKTIKTLYVSEVIGEGMNLPDGGILTKILYSFKTKGEVRIPYESIEYVLVNNACRRIIRELFSYAVTRRYLVSSSVSAMELAGFLKTLKSDVIVSQENIDVSEIVNVVRIENARPLTINAIKTVISGFSAVPSISKLQGRQEGRQIKERKKVSKPKKSIKRKRSKRRRGLWVGLLILIWMVATPFVFLFMGVAGLGISYKLIRLGRRGGAETTLKLSKSFLIFGQRGFSALAIPGLQGVFSVPLEVGEILVTSADIGVRGIGLLERGTDIVEKVLSDKKYDVVNVSRHMSLELDLLYKDISFLEGELWATDMIRNNFLEQLERLSKARELVYALKEVTVDLPKLLGEDRVKTYLVLFQNNMELRPTGGFIGSYGLLTFENGNLLDTRVFDVYSADGQLKGHVEPPVAINNYLGEASWYLRDSNWDPDFVESAERAEWFLDKSMDRIVDGVVAIDLEVVEGILEITGPMKLGGFGFEVTSANLYERIQHEVESDFFPGSRKKANLLTSLSEAMIMRLMDAENLDYVGLGEQILTNIEGRDVQISFHEESTAEAFRKLGWDGGVDYSEECVEENCEVIWHGLVEANVGVNKANYFVRRAEQVELNINGNEVSSKLRVNMENISPYLDRVPETKYKVFMRVIGPADSEFGEVRVRSKNETLVKQPEVLTREGYKEAGVLVEVNPSEVVRVEFGWVNKLDLDLEASGELLIVKRKQAGVKDHLVGMSLNFRGMEVYNTDLAKDFIKRKEF